MISGRNFLGSNTVEFKLLICLLLTGKRVVYRPSSARTRQRARTVPQCDSCAAIIRSPLPPRKWQVQTKSQAAISLGALKARDGPCSRSPIGGAGLIGVRRQVH